MFLKHADVQVVVRFFKAVPSDNVKGRRSAGTWCLRPLSFPLPVPSCLLVSRQGTPGETQSAVKPRLRHRNLCVNSAHTKLCWSITGSVHGTQHGAHQDSDTVCDVWSGAVIPPMLNLQDDNVRSGA